MVFKMLMSIALFYIYLCGIKYLKYDEYIINKTSPSIGKLLNITMKVTGVDTLFANFTRTGKFGKEKQIIQIEKDLVKTSEKLREVQLNNFKEEENLNEDDFTIVVKDTNSRIINNEKYIVRYQKETKKNI
jgi:hypothetical protein